ncbi:MAG: hypothetical protein HC923_00235 [Myxococcales bacterium]|nr:hypothetical protein [Myxococcales bacterium]
MSLKQVWKKVGTGRDGVTGVFHDQDSKEAYVVNQQNDHTLRQLLDRNHQLRSMPQNDSHGYRCEAKIPYVVYMKWEEEYQNGPCHYMEFSDFLDQKLNSSEFAYFKTVEGKI